jgi:hypothetical protein
VQFRFFGLDWFQNAAIVERAAHARQLRKAASTTPHTEVTLFPVTEPKPRIPILLFADSVLGIRLYDWQCKILLNYEAGHQVAAACANFSGKTSTLFPVAALWTLYTHPRGRVLYLSATHAQVGLQFFASLARSAGFRWLELAFSRGADARRRFSVWQEHRCREAYRGDPRPIRVARGFVESMKRRPWPTMFWIRFRVATRPIGSS